MRGSKCCLNFMKKFCRGDVNAETIKEHKYTYLSCGITIILLQESRHMDRCVLRLAYVVLHPWIIGNILQVWFCLTCAMQFLADCTDITLSPFDFR
jgi:hypothetical protein